MRVAVLAVAVAALAAAGCGGHKSSNTTTAATTVSARLGSSSSDVVVSSGRTGVAGIPASALPGVTVIGTGEESAAPDNALVQVTIGSGDFGPGGPAVQIVKQSEVDPVVSALKSAGASNVVANRFGTGPFNNESAAVFTFDVDDATRVEQTIDAAQTAVRAHTQYSVQAASVLFGVKDCDALEQKAWNAALADAKGRAQRLADAGGVELGNVLAVSEVTTEPTPYASATTGCEALKHPQPYGVLLSGLQNSEHKVTVEVALQVTYAIR